MASKTVAITGTPGKKQVVSNLSLKRKEGGYTITAKWKVGSAVTTPTSATRGTSIDLEWIVTRVNSKGKKHTYKKTVTGKPIGTTTSSFNPLNFVDDKNVQHGSAHYYPAKGKPELASVTIKVYAHNSKGRSKYCAEKTFTWKNPKAPTISPLEHDRDSGEIFFTITAFDGKKGAAPRTRTDYKISILDTRVSKKESVLPENNPPGSFTGDSKKWDENTPEDSKVIVDITDRYLLGYNQYAKVTVEAMSVSATGGSAWAKKSILLAYPNAATLGTPKSDKKGDAVDMSGKVTLTVKTNSDISKRPTTGVRLQKLRSVAATTAAQATAMGESWEDTDAIDDGECEGLALTVAELMPTRGMHTWVRVKSWNLYEDLFYRYSEPKEVKDLYVDPSASQGSVIITSLKSGDDGTSLVADLAWNIGSDPETGTELSWSDDENAWKSTQEPETYEFTRNDGPVTIDDVEYAGSARVYIQGLTQGTLYYVRARRYIEGENGNSYGGYSNTESQIPVSSPDSVVLNAPLTLARGSSLSLSWTFTTADKKAKSTRTGNPRYASSTTASRINANTTLRGSSSTSSDNTATQTEWYLLYGTEYTVDAEENRTYTLNETPWVDSGNDSLGSCVVPWNKLEPLLDANGEIGLAVQMGTGGSLATSDVVTLRVVDPPVLTATIPATVTAMETATFALSCNVNASVTVIVRAGHLSVDGSMVNGNAGDGLVHEDQTAGDVAWQASFTPDWTLENNTYTATVTIPTGTELLDGGTYTVFVQPTDELTELVGETVTGEFEVEWANQAPRMLVDDTETDIVVTPSDTVTEDGVRTRQCVIQLVAPAGALGTESYNVYRVTPDDTYLIAEDCGLTECIIDEYAPFGGSILAYRVAVVTVDGDVDWLDYPYTLPGKDMRIDFGSNYVELPYDLTLSDTYQKDFEARRKLSGDIDGYWNDGTQRTGSYSSNLIRIYEEDKAALVRSLGQYAGPVFVRTPNGCAYQADVEVTNFGGARRDAALALTIDATEVALTEEFMAFFPDRHAEDQPADDEPYEEEPEEEEEHEG